MKKLFTVCLLFLPFLLNAQSGRGSFSFRYDQSPPVTANGRVLPNAWAGGLDASQYSTMRLNSDTTADLVVFDRVSNKVNTFVAVAGGGWQYAPEYESRFPVLESWMVLADYDGDGLKDLFTQGIAVYHNVTTPGGLLAWEKVTDLLLHDSFNGRTNLYVASSDIPAITDYDDDGDIDIIAFDITGNTVNYYQNLSRERSTPDGVTAGLDFKRIGQCWGHFIKEFCNDFQFGDVCENPAGARVSDAGAKVLHTGNTLTVVDTDGDGWKDLLFGYVSCTNVSRLRNAGPNSEKAMYTAADTLFPASKPINFNTFPGTYYEDVDGDGQKDLLASPNTYANDGNLIDFRASNWFYKNIGTTAKPNFQFVRPDFLQADMIELGENAAPALADLDGDGDLDLLVGYAGLLSGTDYRGGIWQFTNTGTTTAPAFELATTDYLNLAKTLALTNLIPSFADVDANGSLDLLITGTGSHAAELRLLRNQAVRGAAVRYDLTSATLLKIDRFGPGDVPTVANIDRDGKPDLLIAKSGGSIEYWQNTGTLTAPVYTLQNQNYGGIQLTQNYLLRTPAVTVADFNGDGLSELLTTTQGGKLTLYQMPGQASQALVAVDSFPVLGMPGEALLATAADLDGDALPDLILGTQAGGLRYLKNTSAKEVVLAVDELETPWAFPNPTDGLVTVKPPYDGWITVFSTLGKPVVSTRSVRSGIPLQLDLSNLPSAVYVLSLTTDTRPARTQKLVLAK